MKTAEEKLAIVEGFEKRGDMSAREYAEQYGISPQIIYNWKSRLINEESLEPKRPGPPPKDKAKLERAKEKAAMVLSKAVARPPKQAKQPQQLHIELDPSPPSQLQALVEENARLRQQNAMYRRMLGAAIDSN